MYMEYGCKIFQTFVQNLNNILRYYLKIFLQVVYSCNTFVDIQIQIMIVIDKIKAKLCKCEQVVKQLSLARTAPPSCHKAKGLGDHTVANLKATPSFFQAMVIVKISLISSWLTWSNLRGSVKIPLMSSWLTCPNLMESVRMCHIG